MSWEVISGESAERHVSKEGDDLLVASCSDSVTVQVLVLMILCMEQLFNLLSKGVKCEPSLVVRVDNPAWRDT